MTMRAASLLLRTTLALCLQVGVWGHGYLQSPPSRNLVHNSNYCPDCLAAGGPALVSGGLRWPARGGGAGICGDPGEGPRQHEAGGVYGKTSSPAKYAEGQVIQLEVLVAAFHKGRFGFRICRVGGLDDASELRQLTEGCLDQNVLVQADVPGAQNPGDPWFHLGQTNVGTPCPTCLVEGTVWRMPYQLPKGLVCDGVSAKCILQWYWLTGNSCNPPGENPPWGDLTMQPCGSEWTPYPEEFFNCADILILPAGTPVDPNPLPPQQPPDSTPDPAPSPPAVLGSKPPCKPRNAKCFCAWVGRDGHFPDISAATKCRKYFHCSQGKAFYRVCPANPANPRQRLVFNTDTMACDLPRLAKCPKSYAYLNASPPPPSDTSPPGPAAPTDCAFQDAACFCKAVSPTSEGVFPDTAHGCAGFYQCSSGGGVQYVACAEGTLFNAAIGMCDWSASVVCPQATTFVKLRHPAAVAALGVTAGLAG